MLPTEEQYGMGEGEHIEDKHAMEDRQDKQGLEGEGEARLERQPFKGEAKSRNGKQYVVCPMCDGKGYYNEVGKSEIFHHNSQEGNPETKSCTLPVISHGQQPYQLEQIYTASDGKALSRISDSAMSSRVKKPQTRLPPVHLPSSNGGKHFTATNVRSTPSHFTQTTNLLPKPKKFDKHPEDVARLAAIKLNRDDWETKKMGLDECIQLAHSYPEELEPHMSLVYRAICSVLHGFHPQSTTFACQAACEFLVHMRTTCRPEYDELVYSLLARTADTNKQIRLYANDALDKLVTYIPTAHAVRPIVEKGPIHNNPLVRAATLRLLTCVVALKTPITILTNPYLRETCKRIIETAALLLGDNNIEVRAAAKKLITRFMGEEVFESVYYAEVDEKIRRRVQRTFLDIRAKVHASGS